LFEAALPGRFTIEGIESQASEQSQVVRSVERTHATIIFSKGDIEGCDLYLIYQVATAVFSQLRQVILTNFGR
jgi:hypothetical protein